MRARPRVVDIGLLVYPACLRSGAVVPLDVFRIANTLALHRPAAERVQLRGRWLQARNEAIVPVDGLSFDAQPIAAAKLDALMIPGIHHESTDDLCRTLKQLEPEIDAVRSFAESKGLLVASCSSSCLLAEAGLLEGRRATTSWWLGAFFRRRFPNVALVGDDLIVRDGQFVSSGGVASYFDLALWLVGHFGGDQLRQTTARILVMDAQRSSQAPYVTAAMIQDASHAVIEKSRRWLTERLDRSWTIEELAKHCSVSSRTLLRRFQQTLGMSPVQYSQKLRVDRAKALLESTLLSLETITSRCGYSDVSSFSKTFKRWVELTPREYRLRFGLRR